MTNFLSPSFLVASFVTLLLGLWVLLLNAKKEAYRSWFLFCLSVSLWSLGLGILTSVHNRSIANFFYFIHYFGAIHIPIAFLFFIRAYFLKRSDFSPDLKLGYLLVLFQIALFLLGQLVAPLTPKWEFTYYTNPARFYPFFIAYFFLYVLY